jgi:hypothetical protein
MFHKNHPVFLMSDHQDCQTQPYPRFYASGVSVAFSPRDWDEDRICQLKMEIHPKPEVPIRSEITGTTPSDSRMT